MAREGSLQNSRRDGGAGISREASDFGIGKKGSQPSPERAHLTRRLTASYGCSERRTPSSPCFFASRKHCSKGQTALKRRRCSIPVSDWSQWTIAVIKSPMAESLPKEKAEHAQTSHEAAPPADKTRVMSSAQPNTALPQIPDHKLLRCIGRGAYGEVWLACSIMGTYRAVKVVRRKSFDTDRPFEREFAGIQKFE